MAKVLSASVSGEMQEDLSRIQLIKGGENTSQQVSEFVPRAMSLTKAFHLIMRWKGRRNKPLQDYVPSDIVSCCRPKPRPNRKSPPKGDILLEKTR